MELITKAENFDEYLETSEYINHNNVKVVIVANYLMEKIFKDMNDGKRWDISTRRSSLRCVPLNS